MSQTLPLTDNLTLAPRLYKPVGVPKTKFHQFGLRYSGLLTDDYVHKKFLTVKYAGRGGNFVFNAKGTLDFKVGTDKRETPVTSSEVKITTNIEGRDLELKFDNKGLIRAWAGLGRFTILQPWTITAKAKTNSAFNAFSGNLCFEYINRQVNYLARVELKKTNVAFFNNKLIWTYDQFQLGVGAKLNLASYTLARYNLFASYSQKDLLIAAEHVSSNKTKFDLGKVLLAATYKASGNDYVAKASFRPHKPADTLRFKAGTIVALNKDTTIKAKINNNTKLSLSGRFRVNPNFSLVVGSQITLLDPSTLFTNRTIPIPLGLVLDFAY